MLRTTDTTSIITMLAGAALLGVLAIPAPTPASAQDALGGGNALDGNLSTEGTVNPQAFQEDYRVRNLLVTGNVPGGRGFRGSVGYTAAGDFRGELGSDDLYEFRRESAFSAPAFINYGKTYEQLRFGTGLAALEYSRDFQGATLRDVQTQPTPRPGELIDARVRLDRIGRSSQTFDTYEAQPSGELVGMTYDKDGNVLVARASSLTGINMTPAESDAQQLGLTPFDIARIRQQGVAKDSTGASVVGQQFQPSFESLLDQSQRETDRPTPESKVTGETTGERVEGGVDTPRIDTREPVSRVTPSQQQSSYRDVLRRVVERYAGRDDVSLSIDPALLKDLQTEYEELRKTLRGVADQQIDHTLPKPDTETAPPTTPAPVEEERGTEEEAGTVGQSGRAIPDTSNLSNIDQLAGALQHGQRITKLSADDQNRFNELVAQAELALRQGEFFLAERRFDRALRFNPGNPLASAGMGHAQIGSGLYLSAALTLRTLLVNNPEMIDVRYDEGLIPARGRLESALTTVRERLDKNQDVPLNSFLLAYIGRLLDDKGITQEGLDSLAAASPDDNFEELLRAIWLGASDANSQPQK